MSLARTTLVGIAALLVAAAARADDAPPRFTIDEKAGEVALFVKKKGALKAFAHDHDIVATVYTGSIAWSPKAIDRSSVQLEIDTKALVVRDRELSADDRATVLEHMRAESVLDVAHFPKITFASQTVVAHEKDSAGRTPLTVVGVLTLHGVARQRRLEVVLEEKGDALVVTGEHAFLQSDHGIEPYSAAFGALAVQDEVKLVFKVVARRDGGSK